MSTKIGRADRETTAALESGKTSAASMPAAARINPSLRLRAFMPRSHAKPDRALGQVHEPDEPEARIADASSARPDRAERRPGPKPASVRGCSRAPYGQTVQIWSAAAGVCDLRLRLIGLVDLATRGRLRMGARP